MRRSFSCLPVVLALSLGSGGCYREYVVRDPLTAEEVIDLSRQGKTPDEVRRRIDQSGTVYILDAKDILRLSEEGVDPDVIEHMRRTRELDLERRARSYGPPVHLYYGHHPYGWGHPWLYGYGYPFGWHAYCW
jgi:hypothetical protein